MTYYFKIIKGSEFDQRFRSFIDKMSLANKKATELACEYTEHGTIRGCGGAVIAGGINTIYFKSEETVPEGLIKRDTHAELVGYQPDRRKKLGKEIARKFSELPVVTLWELNELFGVSDKSISHPGFTKAIAEDLYLATMSETTWNNWLIRTEGLEEITGSEYAALTKGGGS